jgi:hypothetical protein
MWTTGHSPWNACGQAVEYPGKPVENEMHVFAPFGGSAHLPAKTRRYPLGIAPVEKVLGVSLVGVSR